MFDKYYYMEKSKSELETDRIIAGINNKFWNDNGLMTTYRLGAIRTLETVAKILTKHNHINKDDIFALIKSFKEYDDVSDLAAIILEKYGYKENDK